LIVSHDEVAFGRDGQLQYHIVARITEEWPPQVIDFMMVSNRADIVQDVIYIAPGQRDFSNGAHQPRRAAALRGVGWMRVLARL